MPTYLYIWSPILGEQKSSLKIDICSPNMGQQMSTLKMCICSPNIGEHMPTVINKQDQRLIPGATQYCVIKQEWQRLYNKHGACTTLIIFGSTHIDKQLLFSMLPSILIINFELILGPDGLILGLGKV